MIDLTAPIEALGHSADITHMDLFYRGRMTDARVLVTDCVVLDLTGGAEAIDLAGLPGLELLQAGDTVILRTGWESRRGLSEYAASPSVDRRLVEALVQKGVVLVLIDSPGVVGGSAGPEHNAMDRYLADHEAYAVENLIHVDRLPTAEKFRLYCFPLHMTAGNTAPCRVVADVEE